MNILWVTPQIPCLRSGAQVRQYHLLKHLNQGNFVTVLSLVSSEEKEDIQILKELGINVIAIPYNVAQPNEKWLRRYLAWSQLFFDPQPQYSYTYPLDDLYERLCEILTSYKPDIIQIESQFLAPLTKYISNYPWIITVHDIEHIKYSRKVRMMKKRTHRLYGWIELLKLTRWEKNIIRYAYACIAMSELDAQKICEMAPNTPLFIVPNGVDVENFKPPINNNKERSNLLFFGNLGEESNIDALRYFCYKIFPHIRAIQPDIELIIVGSRARQEVKEFSDLESVRFIGLVKDVRPYLWKAKVCVVPLRVAGGTRLRILEALAAGCPVVSTSIGAEGLLLEDGLHYLKADSPDQFVDAVVSLLDNIEMNLYISEQGRRFAISYYDWDLISPRLEEAYRAVS